MSNGFVSNVCEAALLAAGRNLTVSELVELFEPPDRPTTDDVREALRLLAQQYAGRGIELVETASGYRIQVRRELAGQVSKLWPERAARYSRALLETLALIAYRQPLTRAEIESVRGVAVNPNIIRTLFERNWIRVVGHRELPGRPELLGTTRDFLDYFGLKTLSELPPLAELKSLEDLNPQLALPEPLGAVLAPPAEEAVPRAVRLQVVAEAATEDEQATGEQDGTDGAAARA
jgi:segregation and condensation protein B